MRDDEYFLWAVLLACTSWFRSQGARECEHVISAVVLVVFIIVLKSYNEFHFSSLRHMRRWFAFHIWLLLVPLILKKAELDVEEICCFIDRVLM